MTSATYETSSFPILTSAHDVRRPLAGSFSSAFPPPYSTLRRRSPSPGPSSRRYPNPHDTYVPRGGPIHRSDDHQNIFRPPIRRAERYNSRSPSSDRYERPRPIESRPWDSGPRWQSPWQDRRSSPSPPPLREMVRRDTMAERMFEPSDSWKQSHSDRSGRYEPLETPISRFPDHRPRPAREYSPKTVYIPAHMNTCRPYSGGQGYRDSHAFPRSDSYRPYDNIWSPPSGDKLNTDSYYPRRPPSQHDHDDGQSSTSIASTPPRRALDSPLPDSHPIDRDPSRSSSFRRRTSPAHSVAQSRKSSTSSELARKRRRSRSSSRSSASSRADKSAISTHNHPDNTVSMRSVPQVMVDGFSRDRDQLAFRNSTPNPHSKPNSLLHGLSHVDAKVVSPVTNGELDNPTLGLKYRRSPPSLLSGEDIEMSPPGLTASHSLPSDVEFAYLGEPAQAGTKSQTNQTPNHFAGVCPGMDAPSLALGSVGVDEPPASATVPPSPGVTIQKRETDADSSQTSAGNASLLNSLPHIITIESVDSPSHLEAVEHPVIPARDVEEPAAWCYNRSPFAEQATKALRLVVLTRLQCDRQTRDERVIPVLRANRAIREPSLPSPTDAQDRLFQEFAADQHQTIDSFSMTKSLSTRFLEQEIALQAKQRKLRDEYLELHQQWIAQCARLDNASKGGPPEESIPPSAGGRSTRRSAAVLGDAVRSDLEMEQIIANLGMEELTDPSYLAIKNVAKIPDMISVTEVCGPYYYDDTNNLVDDPAEFYSASSGLDLWTEEERTVFLEKYAAHPKQFGLIAQHLPNKTAAQCVTYYYLHKKQHVDFRKAIVQYGAGRRRRNGKGSRKQKGNALLADIRRHDDEVLAAHPIESPSPVVAVPNKRRRAEILRTNGEPRRYNSRRGAVQHEQTPTSSGTTPDPEAEEHKRRRRSAIRSSGLAQEEAEAESIDQEPEGEVLPAKQSRKPRKPRARAIPTPSKEATPAPELLDYHETSLPWFKEDKNAFIGLLSQHGNNVQYIPPSVPHKTAVQVSSFRRSFVDELARVSPQASTVFDSLVQ